MDESRYFFLEKRMCNISKVKVFILIVSERHFVA